MSYPTASFPMLKLKVKERPNNFQPSIVFWGTPEFAAIILNELINSPFKPKVVVTAPDKLVGRKQVLTPSPVKELAQKHNISILQPENFPPKADPPLAEKNANFKLQIENLNPDLFVIAAYGLILPKEILDIPKFGSLNVHPSLLPKYRGASPIQAAILNGDQETGVTIILMDEKIDHGPILGNSKFEIRNSKITTEELTKELAGIGANLLIKILPKYLTGELETIPQDHTKATFTKIIKREDGRIDWTKSAEEIERMTRAYWPWPSAYATINSKLKTLNQKILKIIKADILIIKHPKEPGKVFLTEDGEMAAACGKNALIVEEIQLEGKKQITAHEFLNGHPEIVGAILN